LSVQPFDPSIVNTEQVQSSFAKSAVKAASQKCADSLSADRDRTLHYWGAQATRQKNLIHFRGLARHRVLGIALAKERDAIHSRRKVMTSKHVLFRAEAIEKNLRGHHNIVAHWNALFKALQESAKTPAPPPKKLVTTSS
jgi:hypothetical protein